ncbi:Dal81p [Sugiyamaella lignohabitans]|uniref:Dal81p n=1 Tax=Sugiyamaella lignohabitans TaxID=796027 RepID=A0A167FRF2_9ASCO|nr:Dal81p [Sugiyamaella lignohabitans]ANB15605.1 Dal81p [Sugiyamaella lignohabitans]
MEGKIQFDQTEVSSISDHGSGSHKNSNLYTDSSHVVGQSDHKYGLGQDSAPGSAGDNGGGSVNSSPATTVSSQSFSQSLSGLESSAPELNKSKVEISIGQEQEPDKPIRPYRSRRQRPCDYCRHRKMRCEMVNGSVCTQCQQKNMKCTFLNQPLKRNRPALLQPGEAKRSFRGKQDSLADSRLDTNGQMRSSIMSFDSPSSTDRPPTSGSMIEVPPMEPPPQVEALLEEEEPPLIPDGYHSAALLGFSGDQDPFLLQYYNYNNKDQTYHFIKHAIRRVSDNHAFPVQFLAFNDERGHSVEDERAAQLDKIDRLAGKFEVQLLALYFRFVHPTYPIVDKMIFYRDYYYSKKSINPGLLSGLLALSCVWWKYDSVLCVNSIPPGLSEELYAECAKAVDRDIKYPSLSTVQALLLLLQKRLLMDQTAETYAVNIDVSRLIAVAHNIGLHLDCSSWNIPPSTKRLRTKLWATIYIMEKWTSVNLGRPSLLTNANSNVDLYNSDDASEQLFVHLGRLTAILEAIIQELYSIRFAEGQYYNTRDTQQKVDHFFRAIEAWRSDLPEDVKDMQCALPGQFCKNGTLHLAALTIEILLHRIRLRPICSTLAEYPRYREHAAETIQRVIQFTLEITHSHLHAFWYSMTRLNFSTIAHFVFYFHLTSPNPQEYGETRDTLRKWLWALRVLSQGWEEGTGLATLRMDTVFWMGKDLFSQNGSVNSNENIANNNHVQHTADDNMGEKSHITQHQPHDQNLGSVMEAPHSESIPPPLPVAWAANQNIEPFHDLVDDPRNHPEFGEEVDHMLLLNEDIMPQSEQVDLFLGHEVPDNTNVYSEYFENDSEEGMLTTQELHDLLAIPDEVLFSNDPASYVHAAQQP